MRRREVLERAVALGAIATVAGCVSDPAPGAGGAGESGTTTDGDADGGTTTDDGTTTDGGSTPAVTGKRIETTETDCLSGTTAGTTVERGDGLVRITGSVRAPNPCHVAKLGEVSYDADADELAVNVTVAADDETDVCIQCIGAIGYEAVVEFEGGLPDDVTVNQAGGAGDGGAGPDPAGVEDRSA